MGSIQAFRDIANNTSVSDSRYVYFANGKEEGTDNAIAEKQTLCFNAAGKPREFAKPTGIERKQDWSLMRQKLNDLVAEKLGGRDSDAFKKIEKELFGKLVDGRYELKAAEKPLRKRDVVKVLTMMDKAIQDGVDKGAPNAPGAIKTEVPVAADVQAIADVENKAKLAEQMKLLKDVASYAFGSREGAKGGKGYMALGPSGTPMKFLTHSNERSNFKSGGAPMLLAKREAINQGTESLRTSLLEIAHGLGAQVEKQVEKSLRLKEMPHGLKVLSREQVASAISTIAKTFKDGDGNSFKWNDVKRAETIENTTVEGIFDSVKLCPRAEKLKPLVHVEENFPANITEQELLDAYNSASVKFSNSGGGLKVPAKVAINGRNYIIKMADETEGGNPNGKTQAAAIRNGYRCDMAYRAGGIGAPDSKLYEFGEDDKKKVFKLTEFIEGRRLDDVINNGTAEEKEAARLELLKGYPLDCLLGNYDVIGTNPDHDKHYTNIIMGKDGRAYRIDNDGAFSLKGLTMNNSYKRSDYAANKWSLDSAGKHFGGYEDWSNKPDAKNGGWTSHEWIDDCFTLNQNKQNAGIYDKYTTTADIFLAARNIDIDAVAESIDDEEIRGAVQRTGDVMKQMANLADEAITTGDGTFEDLNTKLEQEYVQMKKNAGVEGL